MHTNKTREDMLKCLLSLFFIWIITPNSYGALWIDSETYNTATQSVNCLADGEISMNSGSAVCENTPVTFQITGHNLQILGWLMSSTFSFDEGTTTFIPSNQSTLTISAGFAENAFVKVVFQTTNTAVCTEMFSAVYSVIVHSNIDNNEITTDTNSFGCNFQGNIFIYGPPAPTSSGSVTYAWQMSLDAQVWNTVVSGVNNVNLTMMQFPNQSVYFRRQINTTTCGTSTSNVVFIEYIGFSEPGVLTGGGNYCFSSNEVVLSITGHNGEILEWQSSLDGIDFYSIGEANQTSLTFIDLPVTTYFRVVIQQPGCDIVYSNIEAAILSAGISNNILSSSQFVCANQIPEPIVGSTPSGGSADGLFSVLWQKMEEGQDDWFNIPVNQTPMQTFTFYEPITITTHFRRVVSDSDCDFSISDIVTIVLVENPSGYMTAPETGCPGTPTEVTFHLTGYPPFTITYNDGNDDITINNITQNDFSIWVNETEDFSYTLLHVSDTYCSDQEFSPSMITVSMLPGVSVIDAGMDAFVCGLESTLIGSSPENLLLSSFWTDLNGNMLGTGTNLEVTESLPGAYPYIYHIINEECASAISDTVWVTYDLPESSNAGENIQICSNEVQMQATSLQSGQGYWITPEGIDVSNPFDPYATIFGLEPGALYELLWVAESEFGVCNPDTSAVTIQVDSPSFAGNLTSPNATLCQGNSTSIFAEGYSGSIVSWLISPANGLTETIYDPSPSIDSGSLSANTGYQIIVQSGLCLPDTSEILYIEVDALTQPGLLTENQSFCSSINEGVVEMSGFVGNIVYWEFSTDNFESSEQVFSDQTQYAFQNLETTTQIRTKVQSGICPEILSNIVTIEIGELAELTFDISPSFCSGDNPLDLNSLLENGETGNWTVNGLNINLFNPANYAGMDVEIAVSSGIEPCIISGSQIVHVFESPLANAGPDLEICGMVALLNASPSVGDGIWTTNGDILFSGDSNNATSEIITLEYGTQILIWTENNENCISSDEVQITFYQEPDAAFAGENQYLDYTFSTFLDAETPETGNAHWSSENQNIIFDNINQANTAVRNLQIGENKLFWNVENGVCTSQKSEIIVFVNPLVIPNGFTPNGDGINDIYEIEGIETVAPVHFIVQNRWGEKVYENRDYQNQWDGRHKNGNDLPDDTYYYVLSAAGITKSLNGFIVLKR